jgi:chromosome partitioning protein
MLPNIPGHHELRRIVVLNSKGGSGKSTIATNLAGYLADRGQRVALMDFDPQGSAMRWLDLRSGMRPDIYGIKGFEHDDTMTRTYQLRVPRDIRYLVIDTPAAIPVQEMIGFTRGVHAILLPVLPSDIDIHAASRLIAKLLLVAKVSRRMGRLGVIANRVRENTLGYRKLVRFLDRLSISAIAELRDSQNYVHAAEHGLGIHEMQRSRVSKDTERWNSLIGWLEERLATSLTQRDLYQPAAATAMPAAKPETVLAGGALPGFALSRKE